MFIASGTLSLGFIPSTMLFNDNENFDFSDLLKDDEFIAGLRDADTAAEYITCLKEDYPDHVSEIDLAVKVFFGIKNIASGNQNGSKEKIWKAIVSSGSVRKPRLFFRIAATVILLMGLTASFLFISEKMKHPEILKYASEGKIIYNESRLILSDGKDINISESESEVRYSTDGLNVIINKNISVSQDIKSSEFNELYVPFGKHSSLILSDGTRVWINAGSHLVFPPVFNGKTREVYVEGEAYFEVAKDQSRPFYVRTDKFRVVVLGTKFSVQADKKADLFTALLLEGKVSLTALDLKNKQYNGIEIEPGNLATLSNNHKDFEVSDVEFPENFIAWRNGYLIFSNEPVNELLQRVSRYYDISIEIRSISTSTVITGKLDLKEDPERVLNGLAVMAKCRILKEEERYVFY